MRILVAYDGSECAEAALDDLTRAGLPQRVEALVFAVVELWLPPPHPETYVLMPDTSQQPEIEEAEKLALKAIERLKENFPEWTVSAKIERGSPASTILDFAEDWHPDLIVVGSHGRSAVGRLVLGSVSQKVVTEARCSVRVARGKVDVEPAALRLIIGVDGGLGAKKAVAALGSRVWPKATLARVVAVHEPFKPSLVGRLVPVVSKWVDETNTGNFLDQVRIGPGIGKLAGHGALGHVSSFGRRPPIRSGRDCTGMACRLDLCRCNGPYGPSKIVSFGKCLGGSHSASSLFSRSGAHRRGLDYLY